MTHKKADPALLWDMLDAAKAIHSFVSGKTFYHYLDDRMLRGAVERHLEIIGEAAKGVSKTFQKDHPEIPWHRIIAQRHVLAHEYGEIKQELVWRVATLRIPELIEILEPLVPPLPPEEAQNMSLKFDRFIGIDWSGAKDPRRRLQVAQCFPGTKVPQIQGSNGWQRKEVLDWLIHLNKTGERIIAGFDFAFAYPYCDKESYFPSHPQSPKNVVALWGKIDTICHDSHDFYGGPFYKTSDAIFVDYLHYPKRKGKRYEGRLRKTDASCKKIKGCNPASVFLCLGAQSVGIASISGMRLLHYINSELKHNFLVWPFFSLDNSRSVIVEIFPRLFFNLADQRSPRGWENNNIVNKILRRFGSDDLPSNFNNKSKDKIDAIISAAAIRHLAANSDNWNPAGLTSCARAYEGWIFGVV